MECSMITTHPSYPEKWGAEVQPAAPPAAGERRFPLLAIGGGLLQSFVGLQFCFASYVEHGDWLSWLGCGAACGVAAMCVKELVAAVGMSPQ
jgi:hypothetical protein